MPSNKTTSQLDLPNDAPLLVWIFGKGGVGKTMTAQIARIAIQGLDRNVLAIDADAVAAD